MYVAAAMGRKVYVCAAKRSVMSCLDLPPEQQALLTTNHLEANIHVVRPHSLTHPSHTRPPATCNVVPQQ